MKEWKDLTLTDDYLFSQIIRPCHKKWVNGRD